MNNNNKNVHHHSGNEFSLFVGDLPHDCSDETLQRLFQSKFKSVKRVQIIKNEDGSSRGFGFIRFEDQTDFQAALSQEMKIGNTTLRLDTAHRYKNNRGRYNSFNSTVSNSSNHHNHHHFNNSNSNLHHQHHHNQTHHQHHHHHNPHHHTHRNHQQHTNQSNQPSGAANNNKTLLSDHALPAQHHQQQQQAPNNNNNLTSARNNTSSNTNNNHTNPPHAPVAGSGQDHHPQHQSPAQHHTAQLGHNVYNSNSQKINNNPHHQPSPDTKSGSKQANPTIGGDDTAKPASNQSQQSQSLRSQQSAPIIPNQTQSQPVLNQVPQSQHALSSVSNNPVGGQVAGGVNITASTTNVTTSMPITSVNHTAASAAVAAAVMHNSQPNLNTTHQQAIGGAPDMRGYVQPTMMDSHLMGATEQASVVPPTSFYGHMYPYGPPPPFGYMPPPQPNPVMPISAVPPAPPNQAPPTGSVGQQHSLSAAAVSANRFNSAQQHHHHSQSHHPHPHQPQQPTHVPQAGVDASGLGAMPSGVQAPHQGPFYYYYPSPLYFDQSGGATGAPPNHLYHPQTFHPQFFAVPGPAYLPNAHTFNQHQPPTASQSDATLQGQPTPQQLQQQQQQHPPPPHQQPQQTKDR